MITFLSEVVAAPEPMGLREILPWVTMFVVAVLGAVLGPVLKTRWKEEAKREVKLGPQPFEIKMREEYVTRREFERLESTMNTHIVDIKGGISTVTEEMKGLFRETMSAVSTQNASTTKMIERRHHTSMEELGKVAQGAYQGRQKLWEQTNINREDIAAIKATSDVAGQIGKLAQVLQTPPTKVQPTHQNG
jgi:hypothetical protein